MINWESLALGLLSLTVGGAAYLLRRLGEKVDLLSMCVARQGERWVQHEARHAEARQDRANAERDLWAMVNEMRKGAE